MIYPNQADNLALRQYELKAPDYELIERECFSLPAEDLAPARYDCVDGVWTSRAARKNCARLLFSGDITCFGKQFTEARNGDSYDFRFEFEEMRPIFAAADFVAGNLETSIFPSAPYRSEKFVSEQNYYCNAPLEFLDAVRYAGFDLLTTANNHDLDTGAVGIGETIDNIRRFGMVQTGTFKAEKRRFELFDVCGFKIAVTAFTTEHNGKQCNLTREGQRLMLHSYLRKKALNLAREARACGAEILIACLHWGIEHKLVPSSGQEKIARELAEAGYDCVIGSHPHVLQPFDVIETETRSMPVFYSLGNFVSHNEGNANSRSALACLDLKRTESGVSLSCSYLPVYTGCECKGKKYVVLPIPASPALPRNKKILQIIAPILGDKIAITDDISFEEQAETRPKRSGISPIEKLKAQYSSTHVKSTPGGILFEPLGDHACVTGCTETLGSAVIPDEAEGLPLTEARDGAFAGHPSLMKINLNRKMTRVSKEMFRGAKRLEGFRLGLSVKEIGESAFEDCSALTAAVMRSSVERIGSRAFRNCGALISVKIPLTVREIADDAFENCPRMRIYCESGSSAEEYAKRKSIPYTLMELGKQ